MAGITAHSASKSHAAGATSENANVSGFIAGERIVLGITEASTSYLWGIALPGGASSLAGLSSTGAAAPTFTPDVRGTYLVTCVTDSAVYSLRMDVLAIAEVEHVDAVRLMPVEPGQVPPPELGATLFFNSETGSACLKKDDGTVHKIETTAL